ncbi:MAG TPA: VIT domain-containing protein [Kofleriaceae bacterium]|nr:VIT domain-containing protein [Kofleriaceae bacterium]
MVALPPNQVTPVTTMFLASSQQRPAREAVAPWSLTASDGSGLVMTRIDARAVVEGPLAFTEIHLYFHNPEPRVREGTFSITLPTGAAVSRFAMENNGQFMEAEVVEKQLARRAYEDFLHRRQDPALLEKAEGNQFTARVFPIPARGDKHLVISFSQEVAPGRYTLPLRGLAKAERVDVRVQVRGQNGGIAEQTLAERNWTPDRDVVVDGTTIGVPASIAAGELAATRVTVELPKAAEPPASVTLLVDTSASRALGFAAEARSIHQLVDELAHAYGGALPVQVVAFDQVTAAIYDGRADKIGNIEAALVERGALGASDLGQALSWLGGHAPKSRLVVVTDGVITAGAGSDALPGLARQLAGRGVERIDVALSGGIRDEQAAAAVAHAGLAHTGAVLDLDQGVAEVARRVGLAVRTELPVAVDGARWVFPRTIAAAQAGDQLTVYSRQAAGTQQLAVTVAGKRTAVSPVRVTPALLGRAVAAAEITELDGQLAKATGDAAGKLRAEIVRRSVAARVVSSQTSMLVLETDADYARYGIDRSALADILAIGPTGVELTHRAAPPAQIATPVATTAGKSRPKLARPEARFEGRDEAPARAKKRAAAADDDEASDKEAEKDAKVGRTAFHEDAPKAEPKADRVAAGPRGGMPQAEPAPAAAPRPVPAESRRSTERASGAGASADMAPDVSRFASRSSSAVAPAAPPPPPPPAARRPVPAPEQTEIAADRDGDGVLDGNDDGLSANRRKPALHGPLAEIERALASGNVDAALARASAWHKKEPGDVLALIGLGDALEARKNLDTAARVYGSIIDLYPARADFRRFAGERLERLGKAQRALIIDTYRRAAEQRPDHLTGHRMLAYALVRDGQYAAAFAAILAGIDRQYPENRFAGAERVLSEDVGMIGAAYIAHVAGKRDEVLAQLAKRRIALPAGPSTRFIMYWETDANDVDFHIRDARGGHAWYSHKQLGSGGELYADITTGYGPECFAIPGTPKAGPYQLSINYYSQGPMGYGMGLLQIQKFDGQGNLSFEDRPYVIMTNQAFVDLGTYR